MSSSLPGVSFSMPMAACGLTFYDLETNYSLKSEPKAFGFGKTRVIKNLYTLKPVELATEESSGTAFKLPHLSPSAFHAVTKKPYLSRSEPMPLLTKLLKIAANFEFLKNDFETLGKKQRLPSRKCELVNLSNLKKEIETLEPDHALLVENTDFQRFARTIFGAESVFSKSRRIIEKALMLTKGANAMYDESIVIKEEYWQEKLLEDHPYGEEAFTEFLSVWKKDKSVHCSFEDWLRLKPEAKRPSSSVNYYDEAQRREFEVQIIAGKVMHNGAPLNSSTVGSKKHEGYAIYVISTDGKMYVGPYETGKKHHSSFLSGAPVIGAGEIQTDAEGKILMISSKSGHYKPTAMQLHNTFDFLKAHGVNLSKVKLIENNESGITRHDSINEFIKTSPSPTKSLCPSPFKKSGFILSRARSTSSSAESPSTSRPTTAAGGAGSGRKPLPSPLGGFGEDFGGEFF
jgi:hypothetical protein